MDELLFFIDGQFVPESYFWNAIQGMVRPAQVSRLFDGEKLLIGGKIYQIRKGI